jgi:hypothetical protein
LQIDGCAAAQQQQLLLQQQVRVTAGTTLQQPQRLKAVTALSYCLFNTSCACKSCLVSFICFAAASAMSSNNQQPRS